MARTYPDRSCVDCGSTYGPTGPAQKRCKPCVRSNKLRIQREANAKYRTAQGRNVGTGSGAHNTTGELHPQWAGGERKFGQVLAPAYYKKTRYCERCDADLIDVATEYRCVHHKDHNRQNNDDSNFELLCKRCHQIEHECWKNFTS